jgi:hypothetical protein
MVELSRRFFLGGAISLLAASTFDPLPSMANLPRIYADRQHDDTGGLGALFRNEPVIFSRENIGVDKHKGITFHAGRFKVTQTLELPPGLKVKVEGIEFDLHDLYEQFPVLRGRHKELVKFTGLWTRYVDAPGRFRVHTEHADFGYTEDELYEMRERELALRAQEEVERAHLMRNQSSYAEWERMRVA